MCVCDAVKDEVDPNYEPTEPPEEPTEPPTEAPTEAPTESVCEAHNWELISEEPGVTIFECTYCGEQMSKYEENCTHPEYQTYEAELEDGTGKTITYWCTSCGSTYKETVYY